MVVENTEKFSDKITCESCGKKFSCGANIGKCWCFDVEVKPETLAQLREDFKSCLCEDCLLIHELKRIDTKSLGETL